MVHGLMQWTSLNPAAKKLTLDDRIRNQDLFADWKVWKNTERNLIDKCWLKASSKDNETYKYNQGNNRQKMALCCCGFYTEWKPCCYVVLILRWRFQWDYCSCVQTGAPFARNPWTSLEESPREGRKWSYRVSDFVFCEHLGICYLTTFSTLASVKTITFQPMQVSLSMPYDCTCHKGQVHE